MRHDPVRVALAKAWLVKAGDDLRAAEVDLAAAPPLLADAMFHCQQAAEKALKALLAWHDVPFRKTYDLTELGRQCTEIDPALEPLLRRAAPLTQYAWGYRYSGEPPEPTVEEAETSRALAHEVVDAVLARLPDEARP